MMFSSAQYVNKEAAVTSCRCPSFPAIIVLTYILSFLPPFFVDDVEVLPFVRFDYYFRAEFRIRFSGASWCGGVVRIGGSGGISVSGHRRWYLLEQTAHYIHLLHHHGLPSNWINRETLSYWHQCWRLFHRKKNKSLIEKMFFFFSNFFCKQ